MLIFTSLEDIGKLCTVKYRRQAIVRRSQIDVPPTNGLQSSFYTEQVENANANDKCTSNHFQKRYNPDKTTFETDLLNALE